MLPRFAYGVGDLVEQLAQTDQRIDHEPGEYGERDCGDQTGDLSNSHIAS